MSHDPEDIVSSLIDFSPETLFAKDFDGRTAFDLCLDTEEYHNVVLKILHTCLPINPITKEKVLPEKHGYGIIYRINIKINLPNLIYSY